MMEQTHETKKDFTGEWLTLDGSQNIFAVLTWNSKVTGNQILLTESSNQRSPARGTLKDTAKASILFGNDREYVAELISGDIIEWNGDSNNRWFRKGSKEAFEHIDIMKLQAQLAKLEKSYDQQERLDAAEQLDQSVRAGTLLKNSEIRALISETLSRSLISEYDNQVIRHIKKTYDYINKQISGRKDEIREKLNSADNTTQEQAIKDLIGIKESWGSRMLIDAWTYWIASRDISKRPIIEYTTENMRYSSNAVLPLVNMLFWRLELDDALSQKILKDNKYPNEHDDERIKDWVASLDKQSDEFRSLKKKAEEKKWPWGSQELLKEAKEILFRLDLVVWLASVEGRSDGFSRLKNNAEEKKWNVGRLHEEATKLLLQLETEDRQRRVYRWVGKQLADMSDSRFFEGGANNKQYKAVKGELIKYAVPVLSKRLPKETDIDVRESIARTLGNLGGPEAPQAIDALVLGVIGEEQKREARQQLLATYYLDPSKQRSEEAASILRSAVDDAKKTLTLLQYLNIAVFAVGLAVLAVGLFVCLFSTDQASRIAGGLASVGGLAGIIVQLVRDPLDRIQNAMANLVQIETAFTSFIWELNLNGTFIQSRYVAKGELTEDEVAQTVKRIQDSVNLAMNLVAIYTEEGRQRIVTRLTAIEPAVATVGSAITIHGQHLQGDNSQKRSGKGMLAINHVPVSAEIVSWEQYQVKFNLPETAATKQPTVWISLFIDGMETNALPFHVIENKAKASEGSEKKAATPEDNDTSLSKLLAQPVPAPSSAAHPAITNGEGATQPVRTQ